MAEVSLFIIDMQLFFFFLKHKRTTSLASDDWEVQVHCFGGQITPSAEHSSHAFLGTEEGEGEKKKKKKKPSWELMGTSVGTMTVHDYQLLNDRGRNDDFMAPYRSTLENPCSR